MSSDACKFGGENRKLFQGYMKNWERGHESDFDDFLGVDDASRDEILLISLYLFVAP